MNRYSLNDTIKVKLYQNPTPIFQKYNLNQQIDGIYNRKVNLPGGGYICIDETEALIAIDVNTGKNNFRKRVIRKCHSLRLHIGDVKQQDPP